MNKVEFMLCDHLGVPFQKGDIPENKEFKKICYVHEDHIRIRFEAEKIEITNGPTSDTKTISSFIKDNKGVVKVMDVYVVCDINCEIYDRLSTQANSAISNMNENYGTDVTGMGKEEFIKHIQKYNKGDNL